MYRNASWGPIGVKVGFEEGLDLAAEIGFEGADVPIAVATTMVEDGAASSFQSLYSERGLQMGPWGLGNWKGPEEEFQRLIEVLGPQAAAAREVGATRCATWVPSWSDELDWGANWQFHLDRFGPIARLLAEHDCRLGLEFLGPETLRRGKRHEFVHTLPQMIELCAALGDNVGLLLDSWHWYTSGGTVDDLAALTNERIVHVHVNDAPAGVELAEQVDSVRLLPCASGVIDLEGFMGQLTRLGYDGPVTVEPFNQELRDLPDRAAAETTKAALDRLFALVGR